MRDDETARKLIGVRARLNFPCGLDAALLAASLVEPSAPRHDAARPHLALPQIKPLTYDSKLLGLSPVAVRIRFPIWPAGESMPPMLYLVENP